MSDPTVRTLRLLTLLQGRPSWVGDELADALGVPTRTLRRDIGRLRELGYPVESDRGVGGGYRLGVGGRLPPLLLDDEEAIALVIGLRVATRLAVTRIEHLALSALTKVESLLPVRLRDRVDAVFTGVTWGPEARSATTRFSLPTLLALSRARREGVVVRFEYERADGQVAQREVEPHHIVALERRWYLLGWDLRQGDWRSFRLDRVAEGSVSVGRERMIPRSLPGDDPAQVVLARSPTAVPAMRELAVAVAGERERIAAVLGWLRPEVEPLEPGVWRVVVRDDEARLLGLALAVLAGHESLAVREVSADEDTRASVERLRRRLGELPGIDTP